MAHIEDRWMRKARGPDGKFLRDPEGKPVLERDPARYGKGSRWRLRYLDPDGRERNESFGRKVDADRRKIEVEADVQRGTYIDPEAGKVTFQRYAEEMLATRILDDSTVETMHSRLTRHVYPTIGGKEMGRLAQRPSLVQELVKQLTVAGLAPSTINVIMTHVGTVFSVAVADGVVLRNPVKSKAITLPKVAKSKLVPWTAEQVFAVADALPPKFQAMVDCGAGLGMRQGEILAFSPDDVDWLRGFVSIRRQVKVLSSKLVFAPPKGEKTREEPLPESVKLALAEHMRLHDPLEVTLPWKSLDGKPVTVQLFFAMPGNAYGGAIYRDRINEVWHQAIEAAGIVPPIGRGEKRGTAYREHGMHMLRHYFASTLLTEGESIQAVSEWLGHGDPTITLRIYAHLMPKSEQRMRAVIDRALRRPAPGADGPQTAQVIT